MAEKHLNIISFDIPYPANYGGVIDVFYKIKYLAEKGIKIHLHCFEYGRSRSHELDSICKTVNYYPRKNNIQAQFSSWPYIVNSRLSDKLVKNLLKNNHPILFEGMHTLGIGLDIRLKNRKKIYRESNIEHHYYKHLSIAEKNPIKKAYYKIESQKLKIFEKNIVEFDFTLTVSQADTFYLQKKYPIANIIYLPSFHSNQSINILEGHGKYALYNGNLSVAENISAVEYLISIFSKINYPLIIAGLNPSKELQIKIQQYPNIRLEANTSDHKMTELIQNAQFNILTTEQATGLKLKLLNTLYQGRFCIVNDNMVKGTSLDKLCIICNSETEISQKIEELRMVNFNSQQIQTRKEILSQKYNNQKNIDTLIKVCF